MESHKSFGLIIMCLCFVIALMGVMTMMGADWGDLSSLESLPDVSDAPWMRGAAMLVGGALVVAVLAATYQAIVGRMQRPTAASGVIGRSELHVILGEPISKLPAYRDVLRSLHGERRPSAIAILNHLLSTGLSLGASDIHLTPANDGTRVTLRIHGLLYDMGTLSSELHPPLVSRIKVVSDLAIFKKNTPQDGRIRLEDERFTTRVSVLPTNHGEKVVLRLASQSGGLYDLDQIGMAGETLALYKALLNRNQGVVILTGPTGSGKTTTLYASMLHIDQTRGESVNIVTLEDPIEFDFPRFSQTQIDTSTGLTFAIGLRSVLRQDPDVIMVGEIRDEETASNAMRAAMTGHLIFSTVHADSAAGVFSRIVQIGIEPVHLASAVCTVISQRLCQRLCPHCRTQARITPTQQRQLQLLGLESMPRGPFYTSTGCDHCLNMGFTGLTALYEMLVVSNALRDLITRGVPTHVIHQTAVKQGMRTLLADGLDKARKGEISLDELLRVVTY